MENNKNITAPEIEDGAEVTPQQQCQIDHEGECGDCDTNGNFTPCPGE
jgi:hypothetical protein